MLFFSVFSFVGFSKNWHAFTDSTTLSSPRASDLNGDGV